jgi:hypothetical protein
VFRASQVTDIPPIVGATRLFHDRAQQPTDLADTSVEVVEGFAPGLP